VDWCDVPEGKVAQVVYGEGTCLSMYTEILFLTSINKIDRI